MPPQRRTEDENAALFAQSLSESIRASIALTESVIEQTQDQAKVLAEIAPIVHTLNKIVRDGNGSPPLMLTLPRLQDQISTLRDTCESLQRALQRKCDECAEHLRRTSKLESAETTSAHRWTFKTQVVVALITGGVSIIGGILAAYVTIKTQGGGP